MRGVLKENQKEGIWDRIGIGVSGVCAIHCLLVPITVAVLPLSSFAFQLHEWVHPVFAVILMPTTYQAIRHAKSGKAGQIISALLLSGISVIVGAWLFHSNLTIGGEAFVTSVGSALLITGHWRNWRANRVCRTAL